MPKEKEFTPESDPKFFYSSPKEVRWIDQKAIDEAKAREKAKKKKTKHHRRIGFISEDK